MACETWGFDGRSAHLEGCLWPLSVICFRTSSERRGEEKRRVRRERSENREKEKE